jgi:hypothetical protein
LRLQQCRRPGERFHAHEYPEEGIRAADQIHLFKVSTAKYELGQMHRQVGAIVVTPPSVAGLLGSPPPAPTRPPSIAIAG